MTLKVSITLLIICVIIICYIHPLILTESKSLKNNNSSKQNQVTVSSVPVHIVVSHCSQNLEWITDSITSLNVRDVVIYSKCGRPVEGAPVGSVVHTLPNVGRCDHTYAFYISRLNVTDGVVLFMKDTHHLFAKKGIDVVPFNKMVDEASGPSQFSCRWHIDPSIGLENEALYSELMTFSLDTYKMTHHADYNYSKIKEKLFLSYPNMLTWVEELGLKLRQPICPMCFGGVFAVNIKRLLDVDRQQWEKIEQSLSRADNIVEGHFMERTWAGLLSQAPLNTERSYFGGESMQCMKKNFCGYRGLVVTNSSELRHYSLCSLGSASRLRKSVKTCQAGLSRAAKVPVYVVISHCTQSIEWLQKVIAPLNIQEVVIFSKCGKTVEGAPSGSKVFILPNVGCCDHTYLHYITRLKATTGVVLFMKDTTHVHALHLNTKKEIGWMVEEASGPSKFACRQYLKPNIGLENEAIYEYLMDFNFSIYATETPDSAKYKHKVKQEEPFSIYPNMRTWVQDFGLKLRQPVTPICYGGIFAANVQSLLNIDRKIWEKLERSLSRGDSIVEGHFMERSWAGLLSSQPLIFNESRVRENKMLCLRKNLSGYRGLIVSDRDVLLKQKLYVKKSIVKSVIQECPIVEGK